MQEQNYAKCKSLPILAFKYLSQHWLKMSARVSFTTGRVSVTEIKKPQSDFGKDQAVFSQLAFCKKAIYGEAV